MMLSASKRTRVVETKSCRDEDTIHLDVNSNLSTKKNLWWDNNFVKSVIVGYLRSIANELSFKCKCTMKDMVNIVFEYYISSYAIDNMVNFNESRVELSLKPPCNIESNNNTLVCQFKSKDTDHTPYESYPYCKSTILFKPMINDIFCNNTSHAINIKLMKQECNKRDILFYFGIIRIDKETSNKLNIKKRIENIDVDMSIFTTFFNDKDPIPHGMAPNVETYFMEFSRSLQGSHIEYKRNISDFHVVDVRRIFNSKSRDEFFTDIDVVLLKQSTNNTINNQNLVRSYNFHLKLNNKDEPIKMKSMQLDFSKHDCYYALSSVYCKCDNSNGFEFEITLK